MNEHKQPQQQQQYGKRNHARQDQALHSRLCFRSHAEGRREAQPSYRESRAPDADVGEKNFYALASLSNNSVLNGGLRGLETAPQTCEGPPAHAEGPSSNNDPPYAVTVRAGLDPHSP